MSDSGSSLSGSEGLPGPQARSEGAGFLCLGSCPTAHTCSTLSRLLSGRVGLWKDIFTVSMNEKFDLVYKQKMGKCDLTFDFYL